MNNDELRDRIYRHKKRKTIYELLYFANLQCSGVPVVDGAEVVVYKDLINRDKIWVRPIKEFFDGRFEDIGSWDDWIDGKLD